MIKTISILYILRPVYNVFSTQLLHFSIYPIVISKRNDRIRLIVELSEKSKKIKEITYGCF